eukprot:scaffold878_cov271-Pinguiococcus_pyrenoidosus.AAC.18
MGRASRPPTVDRESSHGAVAWPPTRVTFRRLLHDAGQEERNYVRPNGNDEVPDDEPCAIIRETADGASNPKEKQPQRSRAVLAEQRDEQRWEGDLGNARKRRSVYLPSLTVPLHRWTARSLARSLAPELSST